MRAERPARFIRKAYAIHQRRQSRRKISFALSSGKPIEELERELGITNIVKLASNENPFGFPESLKKAIQAQLDHLTRYPDANGFELKATIAKNLVCNQTKSPLAMVLTIY